MLDHLALGGGLDDAEELLLADERPALQPATPHDHIGEPDQAGGDQLQWREGDQSPNRPGGHHRGAIRVEYRIGLRHRLSQDEEDDHVEGDADNDADTPEEAPGHDAGQGRLHRLADVDGEQQRIDPPLRGLHQRLQAGAGPRTLLEESRGAGLRHLREPHLGHREEDEDQQQNADRDEHQHVGAGHLRRDHDRCSDEKATGAGPDQ